MKEDLNNELAQYSDHVGHGMLTIVTQNVNIQVNFFNVMASGGLYSSVYTTVYTVLINYLCILDTTLRTLNTRDKLHVYEFYNF